jgi:hypothetical protein
MEDLTRRSLLRGAATVAVGVPVVSGLESWGALAATPLSRSAFDAARTKAFRVSGHGSSTLVRLVTIEDLPYATKGDQRRFSLIFRTTHGRKPRTGTWTFRHPTLGTFRMFVSPVGQGSDLQAVFNAR